MAKVRITAQVGFTRDARRVAGARRYAEADRSDPFAFARAMTHLSNGIAAYGKKGEEQFYDAVETQETRVLPAADGKRVEYQATVYTNRVRP